MAHNLEMVNGKAQMAYAGETPWHGLGTAVSNDISVDDMLVKSGLDWNVYSTDTFYELNGKMVKTGKKALVRDMDGKFLSQISDAWNPVQNREAFEFFREFVDEGSMEMHTAGSLRGGKLVWVLAKLKDEGFELFNGDKMEGYLLFSNPHEFGSGINIRFTPIRVVCNNTLTASLNSNSLNAISVNHRRAFNSDAVKETLGISHEKMEQYKDMAFFLGSKRFTNATIDDYFNVIWPTTGKKEMSRNAELAKEVLHTQPGAEFAEGSWWQAFNAVTYLTDHKLGRSTDTRLTSAWFGANQRTKLKALETAIDFAEAA